MWSINVNDTVVLGEAMETQAWLEHRELDDIWQHIAAMLSRMIQRADDFCRTASR